MVPLLSMGSQANPQSHCAWPDRISAGSSMPGAGYLSNTHPIIIVGFMGVDHTPVVTLDSWEPPLSMESPANPQSHCAWPDHISARSSTPGVGYLSNTHPMVTVGFIGVKHTPVDTLDPCGPTLKHGIPSKSSVTLCLARPYYCQK